MNYRALAIFAIFLLDGAVSPAAAARTIKGVPRFDSKHLLSQDAVELDSLPSKGRHMLEQDSILRVLHRRRHNQAQGNLSRNAKKDMTHENHRQGTSTSGVDATSIKVPLCYFLP